MNFYESNNHALGRFGGQTAARLKICPPSGRSMVSMESAACSFCACWGWQYRTKTFMEFLINSIGVDVMAGFAIVHEGTVYDCSLREDQIVEKMLLGTEVIPLQSPRLWCKYYRLMGRPQKADMIEKALSCGSPSRQPSQKA